MNIIPLLLCNDYFILFYFLAAQVLVAARGFFAEEACFSLVAARGLRSTWSQKLQLVG